MSLMSLPVSNVLNLNMPMPVSRRLTKQYSFFYIIPHTNTQTQWRGLTSFTLYAPDACFQIPISFGSSSPMQLRDYTAILDHYVTAWVWTALTDKQTEGQSCEYTHTNTQRRPLFVPETCWSRISKRDAAAETDKQWRGDRMRVRERYRTLGRQRPKDGVKKRKIKIEMRKKDSDIERPQRYTDSFWSEVRRGLSFRRHTHIQFTDHLIGFILLWGVSAHHFNRV